MIKQIFIASVLSVNLILLGCSSNDDDDDQVGVSQIDVTGDTVIVANTFEDIGITGSVQTIFGLSDPVVVSDSAVELPGFIGFYDIDVSDNSIVMTLIDNSGAADLLLPEGRFDRYYVGFGSNSVNSVSLDGAAELNAFASVSVLAEGFELAVDDQFATGILQPVSYPNGGILIELGAGTDLTDLNQTVRLSFD